MRCMVDPMGHFSGWAGAVALAVIVDPGRGSHHRRHADPGARTRCARRARLDRPAALADDHPEGRLSRRPGRHGHRRAAGRRPASAAKPRRCCSPRSTTSSGAPISTRRWPSLPVVIFQFALSPYKDWQELAWTGALIITLAVLAPAASLARCARRHRVNNHERCDRH